MRWPYLLIAVVIFGPIKLVSDNLLYAALVRRLKEHGIEEDSVVTFLTTNLAPIAVTFLLIAIVYRMAANEHRSPLAREHSQIVDKALSSLGPDAIQWLHLNYAGGRPPQNLGDTLFSAGLIDRDFTGPTEVKEYLKPIVARKFRALGRTKAMKVLVRKVEPSHIIILGLVIALGGVAWQLTRGGGTVIHDDDVAKATAPLRAELDNRTQERDEARKNLANDRAELGAAKDRLQTALQELAAKDRELQAERQSKISIVPPALPDTIDRRLQELTELEKNLDVIRSIYSAGDGLRSRHRLSELKSTTSTQPLIEDLVRLRDKSSAMARRQSQIMEKYMFADITKIMGGPPDIASACNSFITVLNGLRYPNDPKLDIFEHPSYQVFSEELDKISEWIEQKQHQAKLLRAEYEKARPQSSGFRTVQSLSQEERDSLSRDLYKMKSLMPVIYLTESGVQPSSHDRGVFVSIFQKAGIQPGTTFQELEGPDQTGLLLCVPDVKSIPDKVEKLAEVFKKYGIKTDYAPLVQSRISSTVPPEIGFVLFVGPK